MKGSSESFRAFASCVPVRDRPQPQRLPAIDAGHLWRSERRQDWPLRPSRISYSRWDWLMGQPNNARIGTTTKWKAYNAIEVTQVLGRRQPLPNQALQATVKTGPRLYAKPLGGH